MNNVPSGGFRRWLTVLAGASKQMLLGKSSSKYMKQFTGGDDFWDAIVPRSPRTRPNDPRSHCQ